MWPQQLIQAGTTVHAPDSVKIRTYRRLIALWQVTDREVQEFHGEGANHQPTLVLAGL